jgi:hypothetical protein
MDWILAALAFAVVMMLLSTAVTLLLEVAHKAMRIRETGLRRLVASLYENVVVPRLPPLDGTAPTGAFANAVTSERFLPVQENVTRGRHSWIYRIVNAKERKNLTTLEFVERLAETAAGRRLFEESERRGEDYLRIFLGDLASKFEDYSRSSSEYFTRRAKLASGVIAVLLAFSININAVHIYQTLLLDKNVRDALIAQGDAAGELVRDTEKRKAALVASTDVSQQELEKNIDELKALRRSLESSGIPIGWGSTPWNLPDWQEKAPAWPQAVAPLAGWTLSVLLAGLLIGLGGPFWFDVFSKLGALAGAVQGMQSTVQKAKEQPAANLQTRTATMIRVFTEAAKANALSDLPPQLIPETESSS